MTNILRGLSQIVAAALLLCASAAPALANDLDQAVTALRAIHTLRADFVQTDRNGQRVTGVLTLKAPGKIRFQYQKGVPMLIVSDGKALTVIDSEVHQVQRWPIGNSPLGALLQPGRDMSRYGRLQPSISANVVIIEVRDPAHPEYGIIDLNFLRKAGAPGGLELLGWTTLDAQNGHTVIRLANQQYGMALDDSQFRYLDTRIRPHQ
jgi:outer membrane lipoprotein-sorting protein